MSDADLFDRVNALYRYLQVNRERYLEAWVAETGLHPSECELVQETRHEAGVVRVVTWVRRRTEHPTEQPPPRTGPK